MSYLNKTQKLTNTVEQKLKVLEQIYCHSKISFKEAELSSKISKYIQNSVGPLILENISMNGIQEHHQTTPKRTLDCPLFIFGSLGQMLESWFSFSNLYSWTQELWWAQWNRNWRCLNKSTAVQRIISIQVVCWSTRWATILIVTHILDSKGTLNLKTFTKLYFKKEHHHNTPKKNLFAHMGTIWHSIPQWHSIAKKYQVWESFTQMTCHLNLMISIRGLISVFYDRWTLDKHLNHLQSCTARRNFFLSAQVLSYRHSGAISGGMLHLVQIKKKVRTCNLRCESVRAPVKTRQNTNALQLNILQTKKLFCNILRGRPGRVEQLVLIYPEPCHETMIDWSQTRMTLHCLSTLLWSKRDYTSGTVVGGICCFQTTLQSEKDCFCEFFCESRVFQALFPWHSCLKQVLINSPLFFSFLQISRSLFMQPDATCGAIFVRDSFCAAASVFALCAGRRGRSCSRIDQTTFVPWKCYLKVTI